MKTSAILLSASLASALASPLAGRAQQCNVAPSGVANSKVAAYYTAKAASASECQAACESKDACMSFIFGLPSGSNAPVCKLFKVAAAEVPVRADGLHVFDKACSAKQVPTTAPTQHARRGEVPNPPPKAPEPKGKTGPKPPAPNDKPPATPNGKPPRE